MFYGLEVVVLDLLFCHIYPPLYFAVGWDAVTMVTLLAIASALCFASVTLLTVTLVMPLIRREEEVEG